MAIWQVQTAKQRFSEVLRAAQAGEPQFITKHGAPVAVIVDIDEYRHSRNPRPPFTDFLVAGLDTEGFELPARSVDVGRSEDLFAEAL